jgi:hypothetical protein
MRLRGWIVGAACVLFGAVVPIAGCGTTNSGFGDGGPGADGGDNDSTVPTLDGGNPFGDVSTEAAPQCQGLQCQVQNCGSGHTTISGTVYDPAGNNPLYNILVYIPTFPSNPLPAITHGMSCDTCAAKIDNAMATALTDAKGHFTITDAPVGQNIPIVVQVGKWRRKMTIPSVAACVDNVPFPTTNTPANRLRLPAMQSEGDMPLIAFDTGCDPMEDLIKKVGVAASEFTSPSGTGMVHVYQGKYPNTAGVTSPGDSYLFWDNLTEMEKYDIIINACECSPYPRDKGYANLDTFLNGGGRFFGSHYHINFFTGLQLSGSPDPVPADMKAAANWSPAWGSCMSGPFDIDTTFPKGKAMADWMQNLFPTSTYGTVAISGGCMVKDILGTVSGISQQWIYDNPSKAPGYISINTPTAQPPANRCGRAVLTDLHVGTTSTTLEQQEAALEFMFFDLAACVQSDSSNPQPPSPN